jgi:hypothetical protein
VQVEVCAEDAKTIAALLCFTAIGVVDAEPELIACNVSDQHTIRSDAGVPVADVLNSRSRKGPWQVGALDYEIVVAETMTLGEAQTFHISARQCGSA